MSTAVGAGGNPSPVLQPGQQVLHLMALLLQPLAVREPLGAVPPGRDAGRHALLQHHGANPVAVVPLISNQHARLRKVPQQELSTGEVAAWPFAEEKADRSSLPVAHHRSLAGGAPFGTTHQARVGAPFFRLEAVRWALTQVASIISTSSGSTPAFASAPASGAVSTSASLPAERGQQIRIAAEGLAQPLQHATGCPTAEAADDGSRSRRKRPVPESGGLITPGGADARLPQSSFEKQTVASCLVR